MHFCITRDYQIRLRDLIGAPSKLFELEKALNWDPLNLEGIGMRARLRAEVERVLLPTKNEAKALKASAAAKAPSGDKADEASKKSTADAAARKQLKYERLAAMGLGPLAANKGGSKRKASQEVTADDNKKQKEGDVEVVQGETAEANPENEMDVSNPADKGGDAGTSAGNVAGGVANKPFNKVAKLSQYADKNPFTISVHLYTEKNGKKTFCQLSKDDWYRGLFDRISEWCTEAHLRSIQVLAGSQTGDSWSPKIFHHYHEHGHGVIIPGDERTCNWLLNEIFPQICFKTKRLSGRLGWFENAPST